jgi:hypothetical protein
VSAARRTPPLFLIATSLEGSKDKKNCSCYENRKGGSACRRRLGRVVVSAVPTERIERTLASFSVDIIFRVGRVRRTVSCCENRKGGSACRRRLDRHYESVITGSMTRGWSPPFCRHNSESSKSKKDCSCRSDRKGGSACRRRLGRHCESTVSVSNTKSILTPFSVNTILRIVRVRRTVLVVRAGKVVVPVAVDLVGTMRVLVVSRRQRGRSLPFRSTQS